MYLLLIIWDLKLTYSVCGHHYPDKTIRRLQISLIRKWMQYALVNFMTKPIGAVREAECSVIRTTAAGKIYSYFRIGNPPCRC